MTVATLGANDIVGEMAILGDVPRTATVQAKGRLVALRIAKDPFMRMVREFPNMAVSIMRELAHRLELTNNQLRTAMTEVQRLRQTAGAVVVYISARHRTSLRAADVGIGVVTSTHRPPWGADIVTGPSLSDAWLVLEATADHDVDLHERAFAR